MRSMLLSVITSRFFFPPAFLAISASGLSFFRHRDDDYEIRFRASIPPPIVDSFLRRLNNIPQTYPHQLFNFFTSSSSPSFSSAENPAPDFLKSADALVDGSKASKCSSGCMGRDTIANAASRVCPAVVNLSLPQGYSGLTLGKSIGSGTIINSDGTILTCAHVVVHFQTSNHASKGKVGVTLQDGRRFDGTVVSVDTQSDIAVVKIMSRAPLPAASLGSSRKLRPGDWVVAMGCPLSLQNTVTAGIISCVDRKSSDLGLRGVGREYLQTDCAINQGNSGGPLVNMDGEVVGVNTMKVLDADGLSFAVPIDSIAQIIAHLNKNGRVIRPWLGLKMMDLSQVLIAHLKEKDPSFPDLTHGVLIPMVTPGSPAHRAGFRPGDVLVELDGMDVRSISEVMEIMGERVGVGMKARVRRGKGDSLTLTVFPEELNSDV